MRTHCGTNVKTRRPRSHGGNPLRFAHPPGPIRETELGLHVVAIFVLLMVCCLSLSPSFLLAIMIIILLSCTLRGPRPCSVAHFGGPVQPGRAPQLHTFGGAVQPGRAPQLHTFEAPVQPGRAPQLHTSGAGPTRTGTSVAHVWGPVQPGRAPQLHTSAAQSNQGGHLSCTLLGPQSDHDGQLLPQLLQTP